MKASPFITKTPIFLAEDGRGANEYNCNTSFFGNPATSNNWPVALRLQVTLGLPLSKKLFFPTFSSSYKLIPCQ
jgi:hypothetical protein